MTVALLGLAFCVIVASVVIVQVRPRSSGRLVVRGNLILDGSRRWIASGASDYVMPFYTDANGRPDADLAAYTSADFRLRQKIFRTMRADGINVVRVMVGLPGIGAAYGLSLPEYVHRLSLVVSAARAAGLRVLVCWTDSLGMGPALGRDYAEDFPFMRAVASALAGDPSVFYEPDNEPNGISTAVWYTVMAATDREWRTVIGYRGVLVIDPPDYAWVFPVAAVGRLQRLDASLLHGPSQLVFANHRYPDDSPCFCGFSAQSWESLVGRWVSRYPILGTEYGSYVQGFRPNTEWLAEMVDYLRERAVPQGDNGMIAFVWSWVDANSLTTSNHLTLDAAGRAVRSDFWSSP